MRASSRPLLIFWLLLFPVGATAQDGQPADSTAALILAQSIDPATLSVMDVIENPSGDVPQEDFRHRNDAIFNGALIALGALGIFDNVVVHWILELHRAVPGEHALAVEIGIVAVSAAMLGYGIWRERSARRTTTR